MKKRIISMLLTVLMVMSLFSGLPLNAYAATTTGANTIEYTMAAGDYVLRICQKFGLNYYTCKDAIMILNNIYDGQWNKLAVGRTLVLPASDYDAVLIANGARLTSANSGASATTLSTGTATTYNTGTASTATSVATTSNFQAATADTLAYYLVPYTMSAGENVSGVCNSLGVNFNIFSPFIKQVNGISDWTKVRAGQTLIIPTPVCPSVGTSCYGVMQHKISGSDTAYGIASANGVNYNANKTLLEVLNQTNNLAAIKVGSWFYYPVPLTVSVPGTGNPGSTVTTTTTTSVTDGNGTTTTNTTTTSKLYRLTSGMSASDGTMLFYVDNKAVTAAPAGAKVTIVTDTVSGKAIQSLTVKHADGKADLLLNADSFLMPSCDARVDATIKSGHDINLTANYSGKASASVGGVSVMSAVKNAVVIIRSTDPNYEISNVYASYKKLISSSTKTPITVSSSNAFIMPDMDVDVEVVLKPVTTYAFYDVSNPNSHGTFFMQVNGSPVTRAAKGAQVTVVAKPDAGYEASWLKVTNHVTGDVVNTFSNSFTMPGFDVDVEVRFASQGKNIIILPALGGTVVAKVDGVEVEDAETNETVTLVDTPDAGYKLDPKDPYDIVRNSDGIKVAVSKTAPYTFKMPKGGVTVTPHFIGEKDCDITANIFVNGVQYAGEYKDCSFSVTVNDKKGEFTKDGQKASDKVVLNSKVSSGQYVDIRYDSNEGVAFVKFEILVGGTKDEELTNEANLHGYFLMPTDDITIKAYFETGKVGIGPAVITGVGTVSYRDKNNNSINTCDPDEIVTLVVTPGNGFSFNYEKFASKLLVTRKDNGAPIEVTPVDVNPATKTYIYSFKMPAEGVNVQAIFDAKPFVIKMRCVDEVGNNLTGKGLWQIAINWQPGVVDNLTGLDASGKYTQFEVAYEDYVTVAMTEAGWSNYDMVSFRIDGQEYVADVLNYFYNFQMIEQRAKDLEIIAVLRPRVPSSPIVHSLSAMYDVTRGGVEFILLEKDPITGEPSSTQYASNVDGTDYYAKVGSGVISNARFTKSAFAGDYVAILANSMDSKYAVDTDKISIVPIGGDADRIIPTKLTGWTINGEDNNGVGYTLYVFRMPDTDVSITVDFAGTKKALNIKVVDKDGKAVNGMVRLFANNIYRDVAADSTFDDVTYKTPVQILRSELALAEGKKILAVDIKTEDGDTVPYTDLSTAGEGCYFTMPDARIVTAIIVVGDMNYNLPVVVIDTQVVYGSLVFRLSDDPGSPAVDLTDIKPGETVYVFDEPMDGFKHLGVGEVFVLANGANNIANLHKEDPVNGNIWKFTMPEGTIILKAEFRTEEAKTVELAFAVKDEAGNPFTDGELMVTVGGNSKNVKSGDKIYVLAGQQLLIESAMNGFEVSKVLSDSGKGGLGTGNIYTVPDDLTGDQDVLTATLKSTGNPIVKVGITGGDLAFSIDGTNLVSEYAVGKSLYIQATPFEGYELPAADDIVVIDVNNKRLHVADMAPGVYVVADTELVLGGGIGVTAAFPAGAKPMVTFKIDPADAYVMLSIGDQSTIIQGPEKTYELPVGTQVKIESATEGFDQININANAGVISGQFYTVAETAEVTIALSSSKNPITKGTYTNGNLQFADAKDMKNLLSGSADTDVEVFINDVPNAGCERLNKADLKITRISDGSAVELTDLTPDASNPARWSFKMPAGGVKVNATFKASTVTVSIKVLNGDTLAEVADPILVSVAGSAATPLTSGQSVTATAGQTITYGVPSGANYKITDSTSYKVGAEPSQSTTVFVKYTA